MAPRKALPLLNSSPELSSTVSQLSSCASLTTPASTSAPMDCCSCRSMVARAVPSCWMGTPETGAREGDGDAVLSSSEGAADTG
ncbi:hypothetical protein D3C76_1758630 [compost metagenome]